MKIKDATIAIRPRKNTEITDLAFLFYRTHFKVLAGVAWILGLPLVALSVGAHYLTGQWWVAALLFYFAISIPTGAVVFAASRLVFGTKQTVRQTLAAYRPMWAGLFFRRLGQKLLVLGLAPLVVGYALRLGWVFTPMIVLLERLSGYTLRVRRKGLHRRGGVRAFGMDVILGLTSALLIAGLVLVVELVAGELLATWTGEGLFSGEVFDRPLFMGVWMCAVLAVAPLSSLSWFFLYLNARIRGEGWDLELGFRTAASRISRDEEAA